MPVLDKANALGVPLYIKGFINNSCMGSIVYQIVYTITIYCLTMVLVEAFVFVKHRLLILR